MWFWIDHIWMIGAVIYAGYFALGLLVLWLVFRALRTRSAAAFICYAGCAVPMAVLLARFVMGVAP